VSISASAQVVPFGQAVTITWTSANASACTASNALGAGSLATSGSLSETLAKIGSYVYTVTCSGPGGTSSPASVTVTALYIASTVPEITGIIPASGTVDTPVTLTGFNFTDSNTINVGGGSGQQGTYVTIPGVPGQEGKLAFLLPAITGATSSEQISVENANGISNVVSFIISGASRTDTPGSLPPPQAGNNTATSAPSPASTSTSMTVPQEEALIVSLEAEVQALELEITQLDQAGASGSATGS
jgi:hypothetical protein